MHVNVVMGGQLDEHLLFWQTHHLYNSICYCTVPCLVFEMEIKYDDDDNNNSNKLILHWT